jgi:hypothetical protein
MGECEDRGGESCEDFEANSHVYLWEQEQISPSSANRMLAEGLIDLPDGQIKGHLVLRPRQMA